MDTKEKKPNDAVNPQENTALSVNVYDTPPYKRSRMAYNAEALLEYLISLTIVDSFLAALGKSMGISDALIGICSSIASLAGLTQVFTVFFNHRRPVKRLILTLHLVNQLMFACLYFLPFFSGVPQVLKEILFVSLLLGGYLCSNITGSMKYVFAMSSVERGKYGTFSTTKEMISLVGGMIFEYIIGRVATYYTDIGRQDICFILFGITTVVIAILHAISVGFMREDRGKYIRMAEEEGEAPKESLKVRLGNMLGLLKNRNFVLVMLVFLMWRCADYLAMPFMGTYAIDPDALNFTLADISVFAIIGSGIRFVISRPVGRFADKTSYCTMLIPIFSLAAVAYIFGTFAAPGTEWMFVAYKVLRAVAYVGINSGTYNLMLDYITTDRSDYAIALNNCIIGLAGFLSTLVGSVILSRIQSNGNTVFGLPVFAQQFLSLIAAAITVVIVLYLVFVVRKLRRVGVETE